MQLERVPTSVNMAEGGGKDMNLASNLRSLEVIFSIFKSLMKSHPGLRTQLSLSQPSDPRSQGNHSCYDI